MTQLLDVKDAMEYLGVSRELVDFSMGYSNQPLTTAQMHGASMTRCSRLPAGPFQFEFIVRVRGRSYHLFAPTRLHLRYWICGFRSWIASQEPLIRDCRMTSRRFSS